MKPNLILTMLLIAASCALSQRLSPELLYQNAVTEYEKGNVQQAIALYESLLKLQPNSVQARTNLGVALAHEGRYSEAISQYRVALKEDPENPMVRINLALAWYKQANFEKAGIELERLRRHHPDNQSLYLLADCYLHLGRNRNAVTLLEPAYQANPEDRAVDYALGTALIRDGQIQKGEAVINRILKDGDSAEADLLMGAAQYAAGSHKDAATTIRKALDLNPNLPGGWSLYGRALLNSGENEGAKLAFQNALQVDPNDFDANIHLGAQLRHDGDDAAAAPYLERALRLRPASPEARLQVGALNATLGHLDEARKDLEQVAHEWPEFQEVHVQLASLYARMNRKQDSMREREIVLKLNAKAREKPPQPDR